MSIYALIPVFPLATALTLALFGERLHGKGHRLVIPAVTLSFLLSMSAFVEVLTNGIIEVELYRFLDAGRLVVDLGLYIDQLTVLMLFLVTGVSLIIQVYASRYMIGDVRHSRFFAVTSLLTGAMSLLVMSSNLLLTYILWEVMGICSYLLISHYGDRPAAARAATKVFLVNSFADVGLGIGVLLTYLTFGTLDIPEILARVQDGSDVSSAAVTALTLCLFVGAVGKSAQMPAHVWLPLAMESPTPVSALNYAATIVNAGPFLLVRLSPLLVLSEITMTVIAAVGITTALFAAVVSLTQTDVKRTLAYSTVSQLGFMMFLIGVGAFIAAIFHLLSHGFLKAFLFLSTGNVLAGTERRIDHPNEGPPRAMGSLFAGAFVLSVIPPLVVFSGPYRDLWISQGFTTANVALWVVGLGTVFFTAMYLVKSIALVFRHAPPGPHGKVQVAPEFFSTKHIASVLVMAAVVVSVLLLVWRWFAGFLAPAVGGIPSEPTTGFSVWVLIPLAAAIAGWAVARARAGRPREEVSAWRRKLYVFFLNKGYFDEIYDLLIVRPTLGLAHWGWEKIDKGIIDRLVLSLGSLSVGIARRLGAVDIAVDRQVTNVGTSSVRVARWLGAVDIAVDRRVVSVGTGSVGVARWLGKFIDKAGISRTVDGIGRGAEASGRAAGRYEPRTLQHNLLVVVLWLVAALGFFYWIAG